MRRSTVVALLAGAVLAMACSAGSGLDSGGSSDAGGARQEPAAGIGTAVRDGKFEFTVQKVQCGVPSVGSDNVTSASRVNRPPSGTSDTVASRMKSAGSRTRPTSRYKPP